MAEERKYKKPPVLEALCEIFFADSKWDKTIPGLFYDKVKGEFPNKKEHEIKQAKVEFGPGTVHTESRQLPNWMQFITKDAGRMIQLAQDMVVLNQLAPYPRFADWEPKVYEAVNLYRELANPGRVVRIGLRYVNQIAIKGEKIDLKKYFLIYPQIPQELMKTYNAFLTQVQTERSGHLLMILLESTGPTSENESAFLLDIYDIIEPKGGLSFDNLKKEINIAHGNAVDAFENSITDELRKLLEVEDLQ